MYGNYTIGKTKQQKIRSSVLKKQIMYDQMGVECDSQLNDVLYKKLVESKKVRDFLGVIEMCSSRQCTIEDTCTILNKQFSRFIGNLTIDTNRFNSLLKIYKDIADAWDYGTCGTELDMWKVNRAATKMVMRNLPQVSADKMNDAMKAVETLNKICNPEYQEQVNKSNGNNSSASYDVEISFGHEVGDGYE